MAEAYTCKTCGAPLQISPETLVAICQYCGTPNWIRETERKEILSLPAADYDSVIKTFKESFRKKGGFWREALPIDAHCYYVPFILADVSVSATYYGVYDVSITVYRREVKRRYDEEKDEWVEEEEWVYDYSVDERVSVKGDLKTTCYINILARRGSEVRGVSRVATYYREASPKLAPFSSEIAKQPKTTILAAELSVEEAEKIALDEARDRVRRMCEERMEREVRFKAEQIASAHESVDRRAEVSSIDPVYKKVSTKVEGIQMSPILLLPFWLLTYEYKGSVYKVIFAGWDAQPLVVEEPVTLASRLAYSVAAGVAAGVGGGLGLPLILQVLSKAIKSEDYLVLGLISLVAGLGVSYALTSMALRRLKMKYLR